MAGKIIIAGATGFIGKALSRHFLDHGQDVFGLLPPGHNDADCLAPGVRPLVLVGDGDNSLRIAIANANADVIVNAAAAGVRRDRHDADHLVNANIRFPCRLLTAAAAVGTAKFIHLGSYFEYAESAEKTALAETAPLTSFNLYGAAKAGGTLVLQTLARRLDVALTVLRLFQVYGPDEPTGRLTPYLIKRLSLGNQVELRSYNKVRDFVYIGDITVAVEAAINALTTSDATGIYNVCSGRATTIGAFATTAADLMGQPHELLTFDAVADPEAEMFHAVGAPEAFHRLTGWTASTTLEDGLAACIAAWQREHR